MRFIKYFDAGTDLGLVRNFSEKYGISENVIKIIVGRGFNTEQAVSDFLWPEKVELQSPFLMKGMREAVETINSYIKNGKRILVFGDYDVDGISATAIMIKTLRKLGADVKYFLPNRYVDGYGLTKAVIDKVNKLFSPNLIITVDCGITAVEEVDYAKSLGIEMIITDHHEMGETLPDCITINTKFIDQEYSYRGLCGTGVAYKVSEALTSFEEASEYLPIVAVATIADIVPLTGENRTLTRLGFEKMDKLPAGLISMFNANKVSIKKPDASDIAFKIAPKLNASGRMGDAVDSLLLYFETNPAKISELIEKIHSHNTKRQLLGAKVHEDCKKMLEGKDITNMPAIILWKEDWDHGVLGIECSKLLEEYNRPVFLFTKEGDELKGSVRSITDINIHDVLTSVSDILEVFGGHTMAAGLTLRLNKFDEFVKRVYSYIYENINFKIFEPIEYYDEQLELCDISPKFVEDLRVLEPCGAENPKPRFLIKSSDITIQPLTKSSGHANIIFGKALSLVFFNYIKEASKLNFGKNFSFIFEIQDIKGKFIKGIVKEFDFDGELKPSASRFLECYSINQLSVGGNSKTQEYSIYTQNDMLKFILDCKNSVFGTVFVANTVASYNKFISTYDMSNIYSVDITDSCVAGYNSVLLAPKNISFATNFNRIVFLDPVLDMSYISAINSISKAKIYLCADGKYSKLLFENLNLERYNFTSIYKELLKNQNTEFVSVNGLYSKIVKNGNKKLGFNNFIVPFCVFKELGIVCTDDSKNEFIYTINNNIKTDLNSSKLYNMLCLIKKSIGS